MMNFGRIVAVTAFTLGVSAHAVCAQEIKIGMSGPTSGAEAYFGNTWMNGAEMAIKELNDAGGIGGRKVALARQDDQGDPKQGTLVAQRFCDDDGMLAVIAHFNSGVTIPASDVYNRCGMPQVTNSSNPKVTAAGYKNLFRPIANDYMQGGIPGDYAVDALKAKTAAIVHDKQAFGQGVSDVFKAQFEKRSGKVTSYSGVSASDVDFSAVITKLKTENPDVVFYGGTMPGVALFLKQMRALGMKSTFFAADPAFLPDFIKTAGESVAAGAIVSFQAPPYDSTPALQDFTNKYQAMWKDAPGSYSAYGYNEAKIILEAMARAKPLGRETIIAELQKTKTKGLTGTIEFTDKGELKEPAVFLYRVADGKFVLTFPIE
jgi:branched-chain amino acid transport system substrate-binding protein